MKQHVWIGGVAAIAFAFGVATAAQTSSSQTSSNRSQSSQNTITVTGCLQSADQAGSSSGSTSTARKIRPIPVAISVLERTMWPAMPMRKPTNITAM